MEKRLVKIGEAARLLGTSVANMRRWEATGELLPARKTKGEAPYYDAAELLNQKNLDPPTVCYARVSK